MIDVGFLAPEGCWDQALLSDLLDGTLYPHDLDTRRHHGYPQSAGCVLVVPGRYWWERTADLNEAVAGYRWLLLIVTSDEESLFDHRRIEHPNARFWIQTPRTDRDYGDARLFGVGYTPHFRDLPADPPHKPLDVFLAAQNTHPRRNECFQQLVEQRAGKSRKIIATEGFTQGLDPDEYARHMVDAKVAPCPSGPASPDSFRVYEALQAHAIPICDDLSPGYDSTGYFRMLYPDAPFPILTNYECLPGYIEDQLWEWPANSNRIQAWWARQKHRMALDLLEDLNALGAL
ncbi:hypothetical protein [Mycobacterium ostraviense]|uniref:Glycosyltransferase n=1 Tax=Mycobacterium ostraviense TaxID=2738409 RepID=A0A164B3M9_9MYCO|nr:hypothetical protein [Mycobacterium ostraviense]KZS63082.1 hypothetical protein A4G28_04415 [Mycobacterium ostraviense]